MSGPLHRIRILDLTSVLMGPSATQILGDMDADIIKIESLSGDTTRKIGPSRSPNMGSNFLNMNRNKRSLVLDLKHPKSHSVLMRLVKQCDVLIHNIRPQAAQKLGLSYETISAANPRMIYCALTGFGSQGPYSGLPAYDDLIQGLAALPSLYAQCGDQPRYVPTPIVDRTAGLYAVIAVTSALLHRHNTGHGQYVEVPMFESMAHVVLADHLYGQTFSPPLGPAGYTRMLSPKRHPYPTTDGWICVLIYNDKQWNSFFDVIGKPHLKEDPRFTSMQSRNKHIDHVYGLVADQLKQESTAYWIDKLSAAQIPAGPMNSLETLIQDSHLKSVGFIESSKHPTEGDIQNLKIPITWSDSPASMKHPAPNLGEHSKQILKEYEFTDEEIGQLLNEGVITHKE
ncbi:MAG: CaiB/BaiF CoA transferase family protein [Burkholderiaceae bacterium]